MAWLKARARDLFFFSAFAVVLANCTLQKDMNSCKSSKWAATGDSEATLPSRDELREMSCACASAAQPGDDCAEDLFETRDVADETGCAAELDSLLFCVEDRDSCDADGAEWACDAAESAWRECIGPRTPSERAAAPARDLADQRPAAR